MSPQMQVLLTNYVRRFTTYVTWAAGMLAVAFYAQDSVTQVRQIASLGFSPIWIPLVTLVLHIVAGAIPQADTLKIVPTPSGTLPNPPSAGFVHVRLLALIAIGMTALAIVACGAVPLTTFNDKAAAGERSVQLVQTSSTALLRAGKLTVAQDQLIQKQVGLAHEAIKAAKAIDINDPTSAAADLAVALATIDALKVRTAGAP